MRAGLAKVMGEHEEAVQTLDGIEKEKGALLLRVMSMTADVAAANTAAAALSQEAATLRAVNDEVRA